MEKKSVMGQCFLKASLTVEASLVLPIFLYAMVLIAYLGQLVICQDDVQWALMRIAREASAEYGACKNEIYKGESYYYGKFAAYMKGSGLFVSFHESRLLKENDEIDLIVTYRAKSPFAIFPIGRIAFRQRVHTRAFTGVETRDKKGKGQDGIVYITETGRVYHRDLSCTYLKLSISKICYGDLETKRNENGGKYKPCEKCCTGKTPGSENAVWITNFGDRYHTSPSCSGLKRIIKEIQLSQVGTRTPCSKCGKGK